jgi:Ca2+-binding EF-hand superfamily protein
MSDQNGDGKIEKSEMRFGSERFDEMDKNGDGFIEKNEFEMPSFSRNSQGGTGAFPGGTQGGGFNGLPGGSR